MARWWRRGWCGPERGAGALQAPVGAQDYRVWRSPFRRLDASAWWRAADDRAIAPGHILVGVRAAVMNFRDVLITLGQSCVHRGIGFAFAGVV